MSSRQPFTVDNITHDPYPQSECDLYTTTTWTLHLRVKTAGAVQRTIDRILRSGAEVLTGDYCGGDSFAEWCEPFANAAWYAEHGHAVHIYYTAPDLTNAKRIGVELARIVGITEAVNATISTAGDWAEQAEIFEKVGA